MQDAEVVEISLEKTIETALVKQNVTQAVIAALKEKYGGMTLKSLDDKESYLEIKAAARDCSKLRNLASKACKEGREDAIKIQKLWVAKEKEVIGQIAEVENPLDAEIAKYDAEVERKANEEKQRQEEAYISRQQILTRMGATYTDGNFVLGNASFEAVLIKGASQDIWDEAIVPKFKAEYERIEAVKVEDQKKKDEEAAEMQRQQLELAKQQAELKAAQAEMQRQKDETEREIKEKLAEQQREKDKLEREEQFKLMQQRAEAAAEAKRLADIDFAVKEEKERQEYEALKAEETRKREEALKAEQLAQSSDKVKWEDFITKVAAIESFEMRSGQYRKKMQIAKEKLEEILSL